MLRIQYIRAGLNSPLFQSVISSLCHLYIPGDALKISALYLRSRKYLRERNIIIYFKKGKKKSCLKDSLGKLCLVDLENTLKTLISSLVPMTGYMH